ncbi:pyridoxamine 5'-phosphate oxidase-domain-containing protein [Mucor mucedo]|uniref:pyridoxamine 5'-phosphate oxidase-domain-containing protein n=1 Tax=Mucor mucedo TaxID=29922 RepID=UPI00221F5749|nr:pyridoxamine 5'-phosphate oxidase-domain-containing protein [Mucor mucedo]KAI7880273.1 pyridoxamine 5'-phosphate oxidase-domain-containing protein [Mucor mucedo]
MNNWKSILQSSLKDNIEKVGPSATYAAMATVRRDNTPAVRTVVTRGFAGENHAENFGWHSDLLVVITDKRSDKIKEIQANPNTEINWYMNGTMEQFRIRGKVNIVEKNYVETKLEHLNSHFDQVETAGKYDQKSLGLQMFLKQQESGSTTNTFNWQAERLRHFYQFGANMRKDMTIEKKQALQIDSIDEHGWFKSEQVQDLLEEAFENFVLLVIDVTSVRHWTPTTGTKVIL